MNFSKAEDRELYHLVKMDRTLHTEKAVSEARGRLSFLWSESRVTPEDRRKIAEWIDEQERSLGNFRKRHPRRRYPVDEHIEPSRLTAEQRRRLAQQRKEPGMGGQ